MKINSLVILLSQSLTSQLFHVRSELLLLDLHTGFSGDRYTHLFKNFPQFVVIHTVKVFQGVNEAEVDVFLEFCCFLYDPMDVDNLISCSSAFSKFSLYIWKFSVHVLLKSSLKNLNISLLTSKKSVIFFQYFEYSLALPLSGAGIKN